MQQRRRVANSAASDSIVRVRAVHFYVRARISALTLNMALLQMVYS